MKRHKDNVQEWLVPFLQEKGVSIEHFSYLSDVTKNTLYNFLAGKSSPKDDTLWKLYNAAVELNGGSLDSNLASA